jgi:phosphohistidine phosphatase
MRIYLAQHGLAVSKEVDPERPLSEEGWEDMRHLARFLEGAGLRVGLVLHSGKIRAQQTAALLAEVLLPGGQPQSRDGLNPNDPVEPLAVETTGWATDTLLVGHLPFLGRLATRLLASDPERQILGFQPGTMACLERDPAGQWMLAWMLRPELIRWGHG